MDLLKSELIRAAILLLQALTLLAVAYIAKRTKILETNSHENKPKIEETRENVSRLINGKGVAHDHARAIEAIHGPEHAGQPPPQPTGGEDDQQSAS